MADEQQHPVQAAYHRQLAAKLDPAPGSLADSEESRRRGGERYAVTNAVMAEIARQDARWGADRTLWPSLWTLLLAEELGEVALWTGAPPAITRDGLGHARKETIQLAALAHQFIAAVDTDRVPFVEPEANDATDLGVSFANLLVHVGDIARAILEYQTGNLAVALDTAAADLAELRLGVANRTLHERVPAPDGTDEQETKARERQATIDLETMTIGPGVLVTDQEFDPVVREDVSDAPIS